MIVKCMLNYQTPLDLAFQALADPTRRAIVERLAERPASVSELKRPLAMSLPAVMQHLAVLEGADLVSNGALGKSTSYSLLYTTGQSTQNQQAFTSVSYVLQGGLVGTIGSKP